MLPGWELVLPTILENNSMVVRLDDTITCVFLFIAPPTLQLSSMTVCEIQSCLMLCTKSVHVLQYSGALDNMKHMTVALSPTIFCNMSSHEFNKLSAFGAITHSVKINWFICNLFHSFRKSGKLVSILHCESSEDISDTLGLSPTVSMAPVTVSISALRIQMSLILVLVTSAIKVLRIGPPVCFPGSPHAACGLIDRNAFGVAVLFCGDSR
jgi:hypothetical protein